MKRTQIQLDENLFELLRHKAFREKRSFSSMAREAIQAYVSPSVTQKRSYRFSFIASGKALKKTPYPVSEEHDRELSKAFSL